MKIYKFRPLTNSSDLGRLNEMLKTSKFWHSGFSELNDPMEGSFTIFPNENTLDTDAINQVFGGKRKYSICSFSAQRAFENPIMWGYYSGGFKGVAIEIEVDKDDVFKIHYNNRISHLKNVKDIDTSVKKILTHKLNPWKHEAEYRSLKKAKQELYKVGRITAVYFGDPYERAVNREHIYSNNEMLQDFGTLKADLIESINNIKCYSIKIEDNKVVINKQLIKKNESD